MEIAQIISIVSLVIGLILLLTSSLFLDDHRKTHKTCHDLADPLGVAGTACKALDYMVIGASFGIVASLIQIGTFAVGFLKKWRIWCGLHILIFLCAIIAFSLPIDVNAHLGSGTAQHSKAKAFLAFAGIDWIFSAAAVGAVFYLTKK